MCGWVSLPSYTDSTSFSFLPCPQAAQKENAQKGGGITTLIQEGTELFLGETAGKVVGGGLAAVNITAKGNSGPDVDFDEMDENEDQVVNPTAAERPQIDHL